MSEETKVFDVEAEAVEASEEMYDHYATCPHCGHVYNIGWPDGSPAEEIVLPCECGNNFYYSPVKGVRK